MNCQEFRSLERDAVEGRLSEPVRDAFAEHLGACAACAERYRRACHLTCREVAEFLHDWVAGELPPERARSFEDHVHICEECEVYLDGYKKTVALGREALTAADDPAESAVPERLVDAILAARIEEERRRS